MIERIGLPASTAGFVVLISSENSRAMTPHVQTMYLQCFTTLTLLKRRELSNLCLDITLERPLKRDTLRHKEGKKKSASVGFRRQMDSVLIVRFEYFQLYQ